MKNNLIKTSLLAIVLAFPFYARPDSACQEVPQNRKIFQTGEPAVAEDVNCNFKFLNDLIGATTETSPEGILTVDKEQGFVGIGTTGPEAKLHVQGSTKFDNQLGGKGGLISSLQAVCTAGIQGRLIRKGFTSSSYNLIMLKWREDIDEPTDLESYCNSIGDFTGDGINTSWHACGVAKTRATDQGCEPLDHISVPRWIGYTSFIDYDDFDDTHLTAMNNGSGGTLTCTEEHAFVCCSNYC